MLEESSEVRHVTDEKRGETRKRKSRKVKIDVSLSSDWSTKWHEFLLANHIVHHTLQVHKTSILDNRLEIAPLLLILNKVIKSSHINRFNIFAPLKRKMAQIIIFLYPIIL